MQYISTRGGAEPVSFTKAIMEGLAPDGGLYIPQTWPKLSKEQLERAKTAPYFETAANVLKIFAGDDLDMETATRICKAAYGEVWAHNDIVPLSSLEDNTYLMELFHGPSLAFKDVAMQMIGELYDTLLAKLDKRLSIICATSGDTGGAAVEAFKNRANIELFILMPDGRVSEVQKRFMTASNAPNVHALILDGDFDGAQALLKGLFRDKDFVKEVQLAPVNSVNFARIIAQCVYFVIAAAKLDTSEPIDFIVPTGNFGDAFSGFVAKKLGANIGKITIANNLNDAISKAIETGTFKIAETSFETISPAMDIQVASNFERILYDLCEKDAANNAAMIASCYAALNSEREFEIEQKVLENLRANFIPSTINDEQTRAAIKDCFEKTGAQICPHTAIAWSSRHQSHAKSKIILATAHPAKFPETMFEVLGNEQKLPKHAEDLFERKENYERMKADELGLKAYIRLRAFKD